MDQGPTAEQLFQSTSRLAPRFQKSRTACEAMRPFEENIRHVAYIFFTDVSHSYCTRHMHSLDPYTRAHAWHAYIILYCPTLSINVFLNDGELHTYS
jgi:hypothetical protein